MSLQLIIFGALVMSAMAQRSSFAGGIRGSGYKDGLIQQRPATANNNNNDDLIGNRNADSGPTTRIPSINSIPNDRLPIDALGDAYLVNHYNSLPMDQRPFWLLNQQHIEAHRGTPTRRPSSDNTVGIGSNQFNGQDFPTRFNSDVGDVSGFNQPIANNQNIRPQSGVVYPINTTPEQQINTEIQFLQQRLNALMQIQNQLQQRNQNQLNGGQISQSSRFR